MGADAGVPALAIAWQAPAKRLEKARLQRRAAAAGQVVRVAACGEVGREQRRLTARDLRKGALSAWLDLLEDLLSSRPQPGSQPGERFVEAGQQRWVSALSEDLVARSERPLVVAGVCQMGGVAVLHRPVEEAAPPLRASFDDREVIGRERDGGQASEELVRIAHRLAVDAGGAALAPDFDLHFAHPGRQIELPRHQRGALAADAHQLRQLVRAQRAQAAEQIAGLQEVRLALPVRSEEDGGVARERDALLDEVAEVAGLDLEKKHLLLHAHVDRHPRAGAPALVLREAARRGFPRLPAHVDGRAGRRSLGAGLERRAGKHAECPIERLPVRVALLDAALGAVLAIPVLLAALSKSCGAWVSRRLWR